MFNKVILVGRLTRDVELKYLPSGSSIGSFGLAASRTWRDKNTGENKEEVMFVDVDTFGRSAEIANQYLRKGSRVLVEGRLVQDRWQDQNGQNRSRHKIVAESVQFMETKAEAAQNQSSNQSGDYGTSHQAPQQNTSVPQNTAQQPVKNEHIPSIDIDDDEIPF